MTTDTETDFNISLFVQEGVAPPNLSEAEIRAIGDRVLERAFEISETFFDEIFEQMPEGASDGEILERSFEHLNTFFRETITDLNVKTVFSPMGLGVQVDFGTYYILVDLWAL